jgi:hypothetical protein
MLGRHDVTIGRGGEVINRKPATTHNAPTSSWQRHVTTCYEAGRNGTEWRYDLATTIRKATKRDRTASHDTSVQRAANPPGRCVDLPADSTLHDHDFLPVFLQKFLKIAFESNLIADCKFGDFIRI